MKIDKLTINGFGKIEKKEITFTEGLNIIYGENESGKSTLQTYITAMLYGLDKKQASKYLPWNKGEYGATNILQYTLDNGKTYIVEKNLNRKTTSIYTRQPYQDVTPLFPVKKKHVMFMEEQTGLNQTVFESSVLIKQKEIEVAPKNRKDIIERLLRLSKYGDENIDYTKAIENLNKLNNEIGEGNTGKHKKLIQINQQIAELEIEKKNAYKNIDTMREIDQCIKELNKNKQKIEHEIQELNYIKEIKKRPILNHYKELSDKLIQCKENREKLLKQLKMHKQIDKLTEQDIIDIDKTFNNVLQKTYQVENTIQNQITKERITQLRHSLFRNKIINGILTGAISIAGLILGQQHPYWYSLILTILVVGLITYYNHKQIKFKIATLKERIHRPKQSNIEQSSSLLRQSLETIGIKCDDNGMIPVLIHELKQSWDRRKEIIKQIQDAEKEIAIISENLKISSKVMDFQDENESSIDEKKYQELLHKHNMSETINMEQIEKIIKEKKEKLQEIEINISSENKELEILSLKYSHPGDIEEKIEVAHQEKTKLERTKESINIAKSCLDESLREIERNYIPSLNRQMSDVLSKITSSKYGEIDTSSELDIVIRDINNGTIAPDTLSSGTIDQIYFSLRLAVASILSQKEQLPIIIDEAFAQYDDTRLGNVMDYIVGLSKQRQVILFTCQRREIEQLDRMGLLYNKIILEE